MIPTPPPNPNEDRDELAAPPRLLGDLQAIYGSGRPPIEVPAELDRAILGAARTHLESRRHSGGGGAWTITRRVMPWAAAAAVLALAILIPTLWFANSNGPLDGSMAALDVDSNGVVNILDAFAVAPRPASTAEERREDEALIRRIALRATVLDHPVPPPAPDARPMRFTTVAVYLDPRGARLAAYQLCFTPRDGDVRIVGVENGEGPAFGGQPPYYDLQAVQQQRADHIVLAMFSKAEADQLPAGRVRVATLHLAILGDVQPEYEAQLDAAADAAGKPIEARITLSPADHQP